MAIQATTKSRRITNRGWNSCASSHVAALTAERTHINMVGDRGRRLDGAQCRCRCIEQCVGRAVALYTISRRRLNILVGNANGWSRTKTGVTGCTSRSGFVWNMPGRRNTGVETGNAMAKRAIAGGGMQVIPYEELAATGRHTDTWSSLEPEIRRSGRNWIFIHANPDASGIMTTTASCGSAGVNHC